MYLCNKLIFWQSQSQKLFSGQFINTVHLVYAPMIIEEQNDSKRTLYPLSILAALAILQELIVYFIPLSECLPSHKNKPRFNWDKPCKLINN